MYLGAMFGLNGNAFAGAGGNNHAFVAALDLNPTQIRIGDMIARSPDKKSGKKKNEPQIAFCEDGNIYIEPVSKKILNNI